MTAYSPLSQVSPANKPKKALKRGFTLIELLTVIAIIGVLAGILIPVVGKVRENANIAASKTQISGYINAINMFKGEYNYYPFGDLLGDNERFVLDTPEKCAVFIETLSARDENFNKTSGEGNRRQIEFYTFTESDFNPGTRQIVDRFYNENIYILIDEDGDGQIEDVPDPDDPSSTINIKTKVSAYVEAQGQNPDYYLYN